MVEVALITSGKARIDSGTILRGRNPTERNPTFGMECVKGRWGEYTDNDRLTKVDLTGTGTGTRATRSTKVKMFTAASRTHHPPPTSRQHAHQTERISCVSSINTPATAGAPCRPHGRRGTLGRASISCIWFAYVDCAMHILCIECA